MPSKKTPVGIAIVISESNAAKISILNGGIALNMKDISHGSYFLYPYATDAVPRIIDERTFDQNWQFLHFPGTSHFVEIVEI